MKDSSPGHTLSDRRGANLRYFKLDGELKLTVLHPELLNKIGNVTGKKILDFGCGDGCLAAQIAALGARVLGVDKSESAIATANRKYSDIPNVEFKHVRVPDYSAVTDSGPFDIIILSLVIVTIKDAQEVEGVFRVLGETASSGSRLLYGDTHPCFHDQQFSTFQMGLNLHRQYRCQGEPYLVMVYDGYNPVESIGFFDYHRPLSEVFSYFRSADFLISDLRELYDQVDFSELHPVIKSRVNEDVPPFIIIEGVKS